MPENLLLYQTEIIKAILETFMMVGASVLAAIIVGLPVGTLLYSTQKGRLAENRYIYIVVSLIVNSIRSFPFLLLVVFLIPFTRLLLGTAIGTTAAMVPLAIIAIAHYSRLVEQSLLDVPRGVIEAAKSMGASVSDIIVKFLFVEARSGLVLGLTTSTISFISYSTIMGVVGGGGIGDFAIRYGYQQFKTDLMMYMIIIMIILVQSIQIIGTTIAQKIDKR
ncbi:methionine ABC transporter permease [Kurthia sibirica]|uniref:Methionine ABC transporter ATP-binding protein n=1 Tax=Kurthia sibirica TaxID=202750 RepID=A0A2U3APL6_9BACL|nr:methionine ABC transporter permease [Kurthia sibirica]PWI26483.1 methionine ABC transporter ATP-binding protein [Kurthia sibirica]GEK33052.1 ABC transporter permease [Kurthia sibirica]